VQTEAATILLHGTVPLAEEVADADWTPVRLFQDNKPSKAARTNKKAAEQPAAFFELLGELA